ASIKAQKIDASFLNDLEFLEEFESGWAELDFIHLYSLKNIIRLTLLSPYNGYADFTQFPLLEEVNIDGKNEGAETVYQCGKLKHLSITHFGDFSLQGFEGLTQLEYLSISESFNFVSLSGIEKLKKLKRLFIGACK